MIGCLLKCDHGLPLHYTDVRPQSQDSRSSNPGRGHRTWKEGLGQTTCQGSSSSEDVAGGIAKTELCPECPWAAARQQPSRLVGEFPQSSVVQTPTALQGARSQAPAPAAQENGQRMTVLPGPLARDGR